MSKSFFEELFDYLFGDEEKCACCGKPLKLSPKPLPKPLPKLTVKIFLKPEFRNYEYAAVDADGHAHLFHRRPHSDKKYGLWWGSFEEFNEIHPYDSDSHYDASDWLNSLIENPYIEIREKEENLERLKQELEAQATNPLLEIRKREAEIRELKNKIGECE